jgi:hypothetical protein
MPSRYSDPFFFFLLRQPWIWPNRRRRSSSLRTSPNCNSYPLQKSVVSCCCCAAIAGVAGVATLFFCRNTDSWG